MSNLPKKLVRGIGGTRLFSGMLRCVERLGDRQPNLLRVLTYHRIAEPTDRADLDPEIISATPEQFARQVAWLSKDFCLVPLADVRLALRGQLRLPPRAVLLTFDDAYLDFAEHAWPILRQHGAPVVLFVPTAFPGNPRRAFWWDRLYCALQKTTLATELLERLTIGIPDLSLADTPAAQLRVLKRHLKQLPYDQLEQIVEEICNACPGEPPQASVLDWDQLRKLQQVGVTLMPHTHTHVLLNAVSEQVARAEIRTSREHLTAETDSEAYALAYPAGHFTPRVCEIAREEGIELGFTTCRGSNSLSKADSWRLHRTNVARQTPAAVIRAQLHSSTRYWTKPVPQSYCSGSC